LDRIAIVSGGHHLECIGGLCELLREYEISLYIHKSDSYGYVDFFCKLFPNIINVFYDTDVSEVMSSHHTIFKLTSNDSIMYNPKIISILHLDGNQDTSERVISLTPVVPGTYIFPIYKPITLQSYENIITFVGYFSKRYIDNDFITFVNNSNYIFNFVVSGEDDYTCLEQYNNIRLYRSTNTETLVDMIKSSKFILSRKFPNYDRFSGMYTLAMSFEKPLIVDKKTRDIYGFPGIVFEHAYSEIIEQLNMSKEAYCGLVSKIKEFNQNTLFDNKNKLNALISASHDAPRQSDPSEQS